MKEVIKMTYEIGKIANTHGIRGEVKIKTDTDFDRFVKGKTVYTTTESGELKFKIKTVRTAKDHLIVSFEGYDHINQIEHLKGSILYTTEKPKLNKGEYHFSDLIGKKVFNQHDLQVGTVKDVLEVPQGHLLQVDTGEKLALVPFVEAFVKTIDDVITIEEIEGLL